MNYVFVSHASEDKQRIKPLIEALVMEGIRVWIDRPGHGDSHFGFDQEYIDRFGIRGLRTGISYKVQIFDALRDSGAVLICLSASLQPDRYVFTQEALIGAFQDKLVACIVDDIAYTAITDEIGLLDPARIQAERIDPALLQKAVNWLHANATADSQLLPDHLYRQWEIVRKICSDLNCILDRTGERLPSTVEIDKACALLSLFPIGPMVYAHEVPMAVVEAYADHFSDPGKARKFLLFAMQIRNRCNSENFAERQILVRNGEVRSPYAVAANDYWDDVLTTAGHKSRRTLGALLVAPGAPQPEQLTPEVRSALAAFRTWLAKPTS